MFELSWPGVRYCMEALRSPKHRNEAIGAIAEAGSIQPSTAYKYLRLAERLGLVVRDADGNLALVKKAGGPEELLEASTLVRLFHARRRLLLPPFDPEDNPIEAFGVRDPAALRSAAKLAKHLPVTTAEDRERGASTRMEELSPHAAMVLEMTRLWSDLRGWTTVPPLLSAVKAFDLFERLTGTSADALEAFVHACMLLYGKRLVRLSIVQYATAANRPFAPFRTSLGYIKWIHSPAPHRGPTHAEPVQAPRQLVSFG
ncbi:hypothetical protein BE21_55115 [Sorangium cellulosum]|uniref:Uncharacterized protein n=1 Tax=Sorangium cellulosum TaxID=56 RepID=A0A150TC61_SORCE|nr:hypothetical protein BE21_55115 [Sorangium cellulosum]